MRKEDIVKLRELPIEAVAERLGLKVKKHRSLCVVHDDHSPSLYFNVKKNSCRCFSCGAYFSGVIDLTMHVLNKSFFEACQWLANENNIILTEYKPKLSSSSSLSSPKVDLVHLSRLICQPYLNDEARHFLFDERHIHPAVVKWLGLSSISSAVPMSSSLQGSWFNAPSLLIPYKDIEGKLLTVQARYLGEKSSSSSVPPRFQFPRGSTCHIFNLPVLKKLKEGEDLWIAEGSSDCMALLSSGKKAIAIPSATLLNHDDMRLLSSALSPSSKLHIYPDQDQAGENLYTDLVRVATEIKRCLVRHDLPKGCKDFGDYWRTLTL